MWLGFGMLLLLAGGVVGFGPVLGGRSPALVMRRHASNMALLRGLLISPARPTRRPTPAVQQRSREEILAELLDLKSVRER
jgi:hypothetical protein